ncbi:hypothetical protein ACW4TU_18355 [Streptomyces sp. QTS52]
MTRTGAQKIPGASLAHFYGDGQYSGSDMETNCGVAHTTEGRTLPDYNGGAIAPTVTGVPDIAGRKIRWYQHYDVDESARALANKLGGVETNTANVFQVELVGTCDDSKKTTWGSARAGLDYLHWPTAPEWALAEVAWLVRWLNEQHGVPLTCVRDWLAYGPDARRPGVVPASYGASPARMTQGEWRAFTGWCGHQHVPENDHGDPGSMNFARVIALAKGTATEEDDMPTTTEIADAVAKKLIAGGGVLETSDVDRVATAVAAKLQPIEAAQNATIDKLVGAVATLAANVGGLDPAAIIAELKQAIESITIHLDVPDA